MRGKTRLKKLIVGSIADYLPWPKNWLYPIAKKKELSAWPRDDWHMSFKDLLANDGKYTSLSRAGENLWDEVALLQYTGGTTGLPKAAMLTHGCVVSAMSQGQAWTTPYTTPGDEKVVCVLPLFHIYALSGIMLGAVRNGNQLILYPRPDIDLIVNDLAKQEADLPARRADALHRDQQASQGEGARPEARSRSACRAARRCRSRCSRASRS